MAVPSATRAESFHLIEFAQFELIALNELDVINWIIDPQCVVYGWQLAKETGGVLVHSYELGGHSFGRCSSTTIDCVAHGEPLKTDITNTQTIKRLNFAGAESK